LGGKETSLALLLTASYSVQLGANMHEFLPEVRRIAEEAAEAILEVYLSDDMGVTVKEDLSPLTHADLASHRHIIAGLEGMARDLPILSEESQGITYDERRHWETFWLVDPLDGTKEFLRRNGEFTINIALIHGHRPVLGVVHLPVSGQTYWAAEGEGAFRSANGETVQLQAAQTVGQPVKVVASRSHALTPTVIFLDRMARDHNLEIMSKGSALKLCMVAEGEADLYPRLAPTMEWDTAAAQCVVEQAGGYVTTLGSEPLQYNKEDLLNPFFMVASPAVAAIWPAYL
jgi:3'(2'), 5'-bisphosphate nucleotidase